jgi:hypothetical protein
MTTTSARTLRAVNILMTMLIKMMEYRSAKE